MSSIRLNEQGHVVGFADDNGVTRIAVDRFDVAAPRLHIRVAIPRPLGARFWFAKQLLSLVGALPGAKITIAA